MSERERISLDEFQARLKAQGVAREDVAMKCPVCATVQSLRSLMAVGLDADEAERSVGFSCIGRFTNAGEHKRGTPPGRGCNWTLGGLFRIHVLEVETPDGVHPFFALATAEEAQALASSNPAGGAE